MRGSAPKDVATRTPSRRLKVIGRSDERVAVVPAWLHAEGKIDALRKVGALCPRCATASFSILRMAWEDQAEGMVSDHGPNWFCRWGSTGRTTMWMGGRKWRETDRRTNG